MIRYIDVCSGISAPTAAWKPLGWQALCYAEIEAAPRAVLAHYYPDVPLVGDFTQIQGDEFGPVDLLVGGTPCQSFSIAGLRGGLADDRGNLALEFLKLAGRARPRWVVWENVPGVFSALSHDAPDFCPPQIDLDTGDGPEDGEEIVVEDSYDADEDHAFGCFLAGLQELGYGIAYRVLDAQYAGVPQRRRRVFVVGYLGDWRRAAAVLFERHGLSGHPAPRRGPGQSAPTSPSRSTGGGGLGTDFDCDEGLIAQEVAPCLDASFSRLQGCSGQDANHGHGHLIAFGGNNTAGPIDVSAALNSHGGPHGRQDFESETFVLMERGRNGVPNLEWRSDGTANAILTPNGGRGGLGVGAICSPIAFNSREDCCSSEHVFGSLGSQSPQAAAVAFSIMPMNSGKDYKARETDVAQPVMAGGPVGGNQGGDYIVRSGVRRLTPRECERLQGFPDDFTLIPYRGRMMADGPRYKMLGNSMAVPVMRWIGERIHLVDQIKSESLAA
ncbi:MAG: DNA cytosine methyltransferase [Sphingobium sp.]|nr:DNA cytosine methyltransferase [Sphingobium sp.]